MAYRSHRRSITTWGGLKAVVWADLFQGSTLLIGGLLTMVLGFVAIGGVQPFFEANKDRLHMVLCRRSSGNAVDGACRWAVDSEFLLLRT